MTRLKILLWIVALTQLLLGILTLFVPGPFFQAMGLTPPPPDNQYILGQLAARFLAYGIGMAWLARSPAPSRFWIRNMVLIQAVDFSVGAFYLFTGTIALSTAAFPMFNALWIGILLWLWQPPARNIDNSAMQSV
ncbi:MAG TPA: hypothetical protein ENJ68_06615 [Devosia sp.]|nr:hypothetical protein [Devosia sp.]